MQVTFAYSEDVKRPLRVRFVRYQGNVGEEQVFCSAQLLCLGVGMAMPVHTSLLTSGKLTHINAMLTLPVSISDLVPQTEIRFTVETLDRVLAQVKVPLFNEHGAMVSGLRRYAMAGPGEVPQQMPGSSVDRVTSVLSSTSGYFTPRVAWMDELLYKTVKQLSKKEKFHQERLHQEHQILTLEFDDFGIPVIFKTIPLENGIPEADGMLFADGDFDISNPVEDYFHIVTRNTFDRRIRPNVSQRNKIFDIISTPTLLHPLTIEEKLLLWKFRYTLVDNTKALSKVLRSVSDEDEETRDSGIAELLEEWKPIGVIESLELLSPEFKHQQVRDYAVKQVANASNSEMLMYLLQLIHAVRFENEYPSPLSEMLIERCLAFEELGYQFFWYVTVETEHPQHGILYDRLLKSFMDQLTGASSSTPLYTGIQNQRRLLVGLQAIVIELKAFKTTDAKTAHMRKLLAVGGQLEKLRSFSEPLAIPVCPSLYSTGLKGDSCGVFRSNAAPYRLCFGTEDPDIPVYNVMFKVGDDLRQDQLVIQLIGLMDQLLKKFNLDLHLTPYRVLATSTNEGFIELVSNCSCISTILDEKNGDIRKYFDTTNEQDASTVYDTFARSCAGYCVITYILGVGDRHLHNIMVDRAGRLFHIDFGYIFGKQVKGKPFSGEIRIIKEMIDVMGGYDSKGYHDFLQYSCESYNIFRRNASLILNLIRLMGNSGIGDLTPETIEDVLLKVQEKFRLNLTVEEAEEFLKQLIVQSTSAFFPGVWEWFHKVSTKGL